MSNLIIPDSAKEKTIISGRLKQRSIVTKNDNRTYFITIEFDHNVNFKSGDSFAIFPENSDKDVLEFLEVLNLPQNFMLENNLSAFDFLKKKVNLSKWSSKLSMAIFNEPKLPESLQNLSPLQILKNIDLSHCLAHELLLLLPPQLPRYYSIASSPKVNTKSIDLLVSLNSFEIDGVIRYGLASSYLCLDMPLDASIVGFIHSADHFRVPDENRPIIMIGPGTGVAPFRAFIQERLAYDHDQNWLFFGERHKASDFYFEDELLSYSQDNKLILSLAFSRDQSHKIYVQDLITLHKEQFYSWLKKDAVVYVCGDAKNMAKDVELAILNLLVEFENIDFKAAQILLRSWRKEKRYNLDVY